MVWTVRTVGAMVQQLYQLTKLVMHIPSQLHIQGHHGGGLQSSMVGVFTSQIQHMLQMRALFFRELLNIYQHTAG